jgi:hypothetical protein
MKKQTHERPRRHVRGIEDEPIPLESLPMDNDVGVT